MNAPIAKLFWHGEDSAVSRNIASLVELDEQLDRLAGEFPPHQPILVDVRLTGRWFWLRYLAGVLPGITSGREGSTAVFPGHYEASVTPAGDPHTVVLGPAALELRPGRAYFVYAIGSLADGTLDLLVDVRFLR